MITINKAKALETYVIGQLAEIATLKSEKEQIASLIKKEMMIDDELLMSIFGDSEELSKFITNEAKSKLIAVERKIKQIEKQVADILLDMKKNNGKNIRFE